MAASTGIEALHRLKTTEPPLYLSPSPDLSESARLASRYLFSSLKPFVPKSPIDQLLVDGFDAEQIWQQIDIQTQPLISTLRRQVKQFENNPDEISKLFGEPKKEKKKKTPLKSESDAVLGLEGFDFDDDHDDDEDGDDDESENEEDPDEEEEEGGVGVEDKFLKIKELEDYLEEDEAREYGLKRKKKKSDGEVPKEDESSEEDEFDEGMGLKEEDDEDEEDDEEDDDKLDLFGAGLDDDGDEELGNVRYEDFFVPQKKNVQKKKSKQVHDSDDLDTDGEQEDEQEDEEDDDQVLDIPKQNLSTHEKELEKKRSEIEQMERDNLGPRVWTMQGEVTAAKRPKNSALEVDLDFEHNVRPAPVITEEVTASLEELIKKRILEGRFDDVQRAPTLLSRAPKEMKEMDENKSKKGLAEIYEDDYVQKTGLVSAALSFSDEQKKEARSLFKKICFKLDALSHFHFTPKPVIEDMSVQVNVPALAMEEIAPLAKSDADMLAPEEIFGGKGDIKEEAELTQEERRRRRANKKRKFKAVAENVMAVKKARDSLQDQNHVNGKIES